MILIGLFCYFDRHDLEVIHSPQKLNDSCKENSIVFRPPIPKPDYFPVPWGDSKGSDVPGI
jgi:hypothetical protein